jgi:hypothetical protein
MAYGRGMLNTSSAEGGKAMSPAAFHMQARHKEVSDGAQAAS